MNQEKPSLEAALKASRRRVSEPHPEPTELLELTLGELPSSRAAELREHISGCPICQRRLVELLAVPDQHEIESSVSEEEVSRLRRAISRRIGESPGAGTSGGGGNLSQKN